MELKSKDDLTQLIRSYGIISWEELLNFVQALPYGRNSNRTDLSLIIKEKKGTCSSKHAFLKEVADLNKIPDIQLIMGIYKMTETNTPAIGKVLSNNNLHYIPEAHCYLLMRDKRRDFTNPESDIRKIENDILEELQIQPKQVGQFKVDFHKNFLKQWIMEEGIPLSFEEIWRIREKCIQNISTGISVKK